MPPRKDCVTNHTADIKTRSVVQVNDNIDSTNCNDILVLEPNNVDGLFFSGFAAYNKGEKKKAITYWDLLLKQLPNDSLMTKEINKRIKLLQD